MWDKIKGIIEGSSPKSRENDPLSTKINWTTAELRQYLSQTGRVPFEIIKRATRELNEAEFSAFFTCPVLAGSAVIPGTMVSTDLHSGAFRRRKSTLLFKASDILNPSADSEPLQKALYPLVKESSNSDPQMNLFTIGRTAGNNLVVADFAVSENHATIELQKGYYIIKDIGSTNGTKVNGAQITAAHQLKDRDVITLGRLDFHFLTSSALYYLLQD